jgi:segregation and condensation protein B
MDGAVALVEPMPPDDPEITDPDREPPRADEADAAAPDADAPPTPEVTPRQIIEALLLATDSPLPAARIAQIVGVGDARSVRQHIADLNHTYEQAGASFRIEEIAGGYQMLTLPAFNTWLSRLLKARSDSRLSSAAMETLAVVAYKQPVTRADIEAIRGVAAGDLLNRLRELNLVKIVGRAEDLGRPLLYGTTKRFLEVFGLASLEDLPKVEVLRDGMKGAGNTAPDTRPADPAPPEPS